MNHNARANSIKYTRILAFYIFFVIFYYYSLLYTLFFCVWLCFALLCAVCVYTLTLMPLSLLALATVFGHPNVVVQDLFGGFFLVVFWLSPTKSHGTPSWASFAQCFYFFLISILLFLLLLISLLLCRRGIECWGLHFTLCQTERRRERATYRINNMRSFILYVFFDQVLNENLLERNSKNNEIEELMKHKYTHTNRRV